MMFYIYTANSPIADDDEDDDKMSWPVFLGPKTVLLAPRPGKKSGSSQVFPSLYTSTHGIRIRNTS